MKNNFLENVTGREQESIQESLSVTSAKKLKRDVCDENDKQEIAKCTSTNGSAAAVRKFIQKFAKFKWKHSASLRQKVQEKFKGKGKTMAE